MPEYEDNVTNRVGYSEKEIEERFRRAFGRDPSLIERKALSIAPVTPEPPSSDKT